MEHYKYVKVFAPATVSNVACGFDILGFALDNPGDEIELEISDNKGIFIEEITGDNNKLPRNVTSNTASIAGNAVLKKLNANIGVKMRIHKKMPFCSGLGSSAASAVAGAFAVNSLFKENLNDKELLNCAIEGEKIASKDVHADNIAPALFGGFKLIRTNNPFDILDIPFPESLSAAVVTPQVSISTSTARKLLKKHVSLTNTTLQCANLGSLVLGLIKHDYEIIKKSLVDNIIEPQRKHLIPHYDKVKKIALDNGALGCNISGSGPSIFALTDNLEKAKILTKEMSLVFQKNEINCKTYYSKVNPQGAKILKRG